jgi:hypothetical protein
MIAAALALVLGASGPAGAAAVTRGPYLQRTSDRATVIRWRSDVATDSVVRYGAAPAALTMSAMSPAVTTEHEVELTGLAADTVHYYSVGSSAGPLAGGDADHFFRTHPQRGAARDSGIVFWITGDQGQAGSIATRVRDRAMAVATQLGWPLDAWLALGDNAYGQGGFAEGSDGAYGLGMFAPYAGIMRQVAIWPCLGNHDIGYPTYGAVHDAVFSLPALAQAGGVASATERWFSFDVGNAHVVNLQWENTPYVGDPMAVWLVADLVANTKPWTIVYLHACLHAFGGHDTDGEYVLAENRRVLTPIFAAYGVDLVLTGHEHSYQRSALVDSAFAGSSTEFVPAVHEIDSGNGDPSGDGAYVKSTGNGVVHAVIGNSSKGGAMPPLHPVVRFARAGNGSALLCVTCDRMEFRYVDQYSGITDRFDLVKPSACAVPGCATGTVPPAGGASGPYPVLRVNGSSGGPLRTVTVPAGVPMSLSVVHPAGGSASVLEVFGRIGAAAPAEALLVPGWGQFCFPPKPMQPANSALFALGIPRTDPAPVALPWSRNYPVPLSMAGRTVDLQGAITLGGVRHVTNRVRVRVE